MRYLADRPVGPCCPWRCPKCGRVGATAPWPLRLAWMGYRVICPVCAAFVAEAVAAIPPC